MQLSRGSARLDREAIVEAMLRIADAEGLQAVSMRRVAAELGCAAMSLYHHFEGKDALLRVMADHAMADLPEVDIDAPWQEEMTRLFGAIYELYLRHPAVARVMVDQPLKGPNSLRVGERMLKTLLAAGFDDDSSVEVFYALITYTTGASLYEIARRDMGSDWFADVDATEHPTIDRLRPRPDAVSSDAQFRRGLKRILDSFATVPSPPCQNSRNPATRSHGSARNRGR